MKIKYKVKKAASGLQDVSVPEQGSYSNVLSSSASLAGTGSQFGPIGTGLGVVAGLGIGLLQKKKQDSLARQAKAINLDNKMNRAYAGDEDTINQGMQRFKKGGRVNYKVIEIEGKRTPEIHTDKNYNLKNLGTTPHSKGGDKVHAEEGDIVFNTQNSLAKYNKIANAIQEGDKTTLNKEKNKLPEDNTKAQTGTRITKTYGGKGRYKKGDIIKSGTRLPVGSNVSNMPNGSQIIREGKPTTGLPRTTNITGYELPNRASQPLSQSKISGNLDMSVNPGAFDVPNKNRNYLSKDPAFEGYKLPGKVFPTSTKRKPNTQGKQVRKTTPITSVVDNPQVGKFTPNMNMDEPDLSDLKNRKTVDQVAESAKDMKTLDEASKSISSPSQTTSPTQKGQGLTNAMQFAGVANNIFQGLKNEPKIDEQYYNPDKIKYTDRSQALRKQSSQAATIGNSNARNLSAGNVGNLRANMNANRVADLDRQGNIDEREQGRADAIQAQNVGMQNEAKNINLQRRDNYQQLNMQNRAAKQAYIDQAASDIGQYGMAQREESYLRSRDSKAEAAQTAGYNSINGRYQHKSNLDGSTYFENDSNNAITRFGNGSTTVNKKRKFGLFAKGTKSVNTKYKMK